jgi:biotin transport system substrate-specific component
MLRTIKSFAIIGSFFEVLVVGFGVVLLFACAQVSIPLHPVPISLQTVGVMLLALTYSKINALRSLLLYIGLGALGLPVFAGFHSGISVVLGTSGGYILGFVVCIYVMNLVKDFFKADSWVGIFINCLVGTVVIYTFGLIWLSLYVGFEKAIQVGLLPFILPGIIKATLLTTLLKGIGNVKGNKG